MTTFIRPDTFIRPWLLVLTLILSLVQFSSADIYYLPGTTQDCAWTAYVWKDSNSGEYVGYARITGYTGSGGAVVIPPSVSATAVIDYVQVWIECPVTAIENSAFYQCSGLTGVTIPLSVTTIGAGAFAGCIGLTDVTIPSSVTSIGYGAFLNCYGLTRITLPPGLTSISESLLENCYRLTTISIPGNVISIGESAFRYTGLTSVTIPANVTSIGYQVFGQCAGLKSVTIPANVTSLGERAFYQCSGLKSITIPPSVTTIGISAFEDCSSLQSVTIPSHLTNLGDYAFCRCSALKSVVIPGSIRGVGWRVFWSCSGLESATILSGASEVSGDMFGSCDHLKRVTIPEGVTRIRNSAFSNCTALSSVEIPNSVTSIEDYAFNACSSLPSIIVPASVTSMGYCAVSTGMSSAFFLGNAPTMTDLSFNEQPYFTFYYFNDKSGFTSPTWHGHNSVNMGNSSPTAIWLLSNGLPYNANLQDDPNGDGVNLLMAYALNLDPQQNLSGSMPRPVCTANQMSLTFYAASAGVTYTVESSTDLQSWITDGVTVLVDPQDSNSRTATVIRSGPARFMRLGVHY